MRPQGRQAVNLAAAQRRSKTVLFESSWHIGQPHGGPAAEMGRASFRERVKKLKVPEKTGTYSSCSGQHPKATDGKKKKKLTPAGFRTHKGR